jgi:hypothetical protein
MLLQRVLQGHISGDVESTKNSGALFDGGTASNVGMVAAGIPKNDHHHLQHQLRHDEESSRPARQPWRGLQLP